MIISFATGSRFALQEQDLSATATTNAGEAKYCFCKSVQNEEECQVEKHGKELSELRHFQASQGKCCKWSQRGGWTKSGPGRKYSEEDRIMCLKLQAKSCCLTPHGFSFYISKLSYSAYNDRVYASLADSWGATNKGNFIPEYLLYNFVHESHGENFDCKTITPHSDTCELDVDEDTFRYFPQEANTCCRSEDYGLSFNVAGLHRIKGWYDGEEFVARRDITGAYVNGQRFPAKAIQHYISTLPEFWAGNRHYGPDWPYFCTELKVSTSCELIANQPDCQSTDCQRHANWHKLRIANKPWQRHDHHDPQCCLIDVRGGKMSVFVRTTFTVPFFDQRDEDKPQPFSDFEYITGSTSEGKQVSAQQTIDILRKHIVTENRGYYGFVCEKLSTRAMSTCPLVEKRAQ